MRPDRPFGRCVDHWSTGRPCGRWALVKLGKAAVCLFHFERRLKEKGRAIRRALACLG